MTLSTTPYLPVGDAPAIVAARLAALAIDHPTTAGVLTVFPLLGDSPAQAPYRTLAQAVAHDSVRIREIDAGGSVPELLVLNEGPMPLLLIDGEELIGGKQNRIVNATCLIPAHSKRHVPVSCVEAGRWHYQREDFAASDRILYARSRARNVRDVTASLQDRGERQADQSAIWSDIAERSERFGLRSETCAAAVLYEAHDDQLRGLIADVAARPDQVGAIFVLPTGRGIELFDSAQTFGKLVPKLLRSWGLEALSLPAASAGKPTRRTASSLLSAVTKAAASATRFDSFGLGQELRFDTPTLSGAALLHDNHIVHLTAHKGLVA